jgi:hypothetical protein
MSWQNQAGQPFPGQSGSPYPGYQPFSGYPGQAGQPFSSRPGYPGIGLPQQAAPEIPPEAIAAARAAGLGTPTSEFRKSAGGTKLPGTGGLNFGLIIGGISVLVGVVTVLITVPFPFNLIFAAVIVVSILPFLPMLIRLANAFNGGGNNAGAFRAWGCPGGLVYTQNGQMSSVRWSEISQIWRKIGMINGVMTVIGYIVQTRNAQQFEFSLLGGAYAGLLNAFGGNRGGSLSISSGAGEMVNAGGFTQISGMVDLSEYAGLGDLLEEQMLKFQLPNALETYRSGGTIGFGRFVVRRQGLSDGARELAWAEVDRVQISVPAIQITKKPASMVWFNLSAANTPNMAMLAAVLNTIQGGNA